MQFDLSLTITGIIALSAIISPIIVAIVNNRYQLKLKKFEKYELNKTLALKEFLGAWGEHYSKYSPQTEREFLAKLYELLLYFQIDFELLNEIKISTNRDSLDSSVNKLLIKLSTQMKATKQSPIKRIFHTITKPLNHDFSKNNESQKS